MRNSTRNTTEIAERRQHVAARYLQGEYQSVIAQSLGIDTATVSRDLAAIRQAWLESAVRDFDAAKAEELARIDAVERAAWDGWRKSQEEKQIGVLEESDDPIVYTDAKGVPQVRSKVRKRKSMRKEGQAGSPAFLNTILTCIERRCAILGLDAPKRFKIDWDALDDAQIERLAKGEPPEKVLSA